MKKFLAASMMALVFVAGIADAKSRGGSSGRSSFSRPSVSKTVASKPTPKLNLQKPAAPVSKPKAAVYSTPKTTTVVKQAPTKAAVVSTPRATTVVKKAPVRRVASPIQYKKTVVVHKTVYRPRYGYNRPYYGYRNYGYNNYYGGGYGYNGGYGSSGFGSSLMGGVLGAMAGMYLYDTLTDEECAKDENGACLQQPQAVESQAPQEDNFGLGGMLPPDAPLMMSPSYYNQ